MITIYHNPRCSKSRCALELLNDNGIDPDVVLYLEQGLDLDTLKHLTTTLKCSMRDIIRKGEIEYKELDLSRTNLSESDLMVAVSENPKLLERPIVVNNGKAIVGRPPENILTLL